MKTLGKAFADRIMELLIKHDISKYRLEKETGLAHSTMLDTFKGEYKDVKTSTVAKVAKFFGMTLGEFFDSPHFDLTEIEYE